MFKKLLFLALACFGIRPAFAYYIAAQVWYGQGTKYIITGEQHKTNEKNNKVALQQMYDLITWAKRLNAHVTVEDPFTTNSEKFTRDPFNYLNTEYCAAIPTLLTLNNQTALANFSSLCHLAGISVDNIEFRRGHYKIPASQFYNHLMATIAHIKLFNDGAPFNRIYQEELLEFETMQKNMPEFFNLIKNEHTLSLYELVDKHNKYTKEHVKLGLRTIEIDKLSMPDLIALESKLRIKDTVQKEFNILMRYNKARIKRNQPLINIDDLDQLSETTALELKIAFEARLFDLIMLHATIATHHPIQIICVGDAHREWLSMRFEQLGYTKLGECISPEHNDPGKTVPINIDQFLSAQFPGINKLSNGIAESILALGKVMDACGLLSDAPHLELSNSAKICSAAFITAATVIPSAAVGYIAGCCINPNQTVQIAGKAIRIQDIVKIGTYLTSVAASSYAGYKYLVAPQPIEK